MEPADRPTPGSWLSLLYVTPDGLVRSGRLTTEHPGAGSEAPALVTRTGRPVPPGDVLALLAPTRLTDDQRALLCRATQGGYHVEEA